MIGSFVLVYGETEPRARRTLRVCVPLWRLRPQALCFLGCPAHLFQNASGDFKFGTTLFNLHLHFKKQNWSQWRSRSLWPHKLSCLCAEVLFGKLLFHLAHCLHLESRMNSCGFLSRGRGHDQPHKTFYWPPKYWIPLSQHLRAAMQTLTALMRGNIKAAGW